MVLPPVISHYALVQINKTLLSEDIIPKEEFYKIQDTEANEETGHHAECRIQPAHDGEPCEEVDRRQEHVRNAVCDAEHSEQYDANDHARHVLVVKLVDNGGEQTDHQKARRKRDHRRHFMHKALPEAVLHTPDQDEYRNNDNEEEIEIHITREPSARLPCL
jgi:hypothetical protein